jgi:hypothetical protein
MDDGDASSVALDACSFSAEPEGAGDDGLEREMAAASPAAADAGDAGAPCPLSLPRTLSEDAPRERELPAALLSCTDRSTSTHAAACSADCARKCRFLSQ